MATATLNPIRTAPVTVAQNTKLVFNKRIGDEDFYDVHYFNHETGVVVEMPANTSDEDLVRLYQEVSAL
jgi:hypothetical protein